MVVLTLLVTASMLGVGAFSLAPALADLLPNPYHQLLFGAGGMLYLLLGVASYRQLILRLQVAGGEYGMLSRYWNRQLGRMAGICSVLAGFAVPAAISSRILAEEWLSHGAWNPALTPALAIGLLVTLAAASRRLRIAQALCVGAGAIILLLLLALLAAALPLWNAAPLPPASDLAPSPARWAELPLLLCFAFSGFNAVIYLPQIDQIPARVSVTAMCWGSGIGMLLILLVNACALQLAPAQVAAGMDSIRALATALPDWQSATVALWMSCLLGTTLISLLLAPSVMAMMQNANAPDRPRNLLLFLALTAGLICVPITHVVLAIGGLLLLLCMTLSVSLLLRRDLARGVHRAPTSACVPGCWAAQIFIACNGLILLLSLWQQPWLLALVGLVTLLTLWLTNRPAFPSAVISPANS